MHAMNHPAEDEAGPEGMKTRNAPDELGAALPNDVEGHSSCHRPRTRPARRA